MLFYLKNEIEASNTEDLPNMAGNVPEFELLALVAEALLGRHEDAKTGAGDIDEVLEVDGGAHGQLVKNGLRLFDLGSVESAGQVYFAVIAQPDIKHSSSGNSSSG